MYPATQMNPRPRRHLGLFGRMFRLLGLTVALTGLFSLVVLRLDPIWEHSLVVRVIPGPKWPVPGITIGLRDWACRWGVRPVLVHFGRAGSSVNIASGHIETRWHNVIVMALAVVLPAVVLAGLWHLKSIRRSRREEALPQLHQSSA